VTDSVLLVDAGVDFYIPEAVTFTAGGAVIAAQGILNDGMLNANGNALTAPSFENNGVLKLTGAEDLSGLARDLDSGIVEYTGPVTDWSYGYSYYDLTLDEGGILDSALNVNGTLDLTGTLNAENRTITAGTFQNGGTLQVLGTEDFSGLTNDLNSGTIEYTRRDGATVTSLGFGNRYHGLKFSGDANYVLSDALDISGDFTNTATSFEHSGTVTLSGSGTVTSGGAHFQDVTVAAEGAYTLADTFDVNGDLLLSKGTLSGSDKTIQLAGRWLESGGIFDYGSSTVVLDGAGLQTVLTEDSDYYGDRDFYNLVHSGSGKMQLGSELAVDHNFTQSAGTLDPNGYGITVDGTADMAGGALELFAGSNTFGTLRVRNGVEVDASAADVSVTHLDLQDTSVFTAPGSGKTFNVSGNFATDSESNFSANGGTVTLNGASQVISGNNTFYNLKKSSSSAPTLSFEAGATQTVGGALMLAGTAGHELKLRSTISGSSWLIHLSGTATASYLNVQDSTNTGALIEAANSTDNGNNSGWSFVASQLFVWLGAISTDWFNPVNWSIGGGALPGSTDDVLIVSKSLQPALSDTVSIHDLTLESGTSLTLNGYDLTVSGTFTNSGTMIAKGTETFSNGWMVLFRIRSKAALGVLREMV
jgi:hypothetical protein